LQDHDVAERQANIHSKQLENERNAINNKAEEDKNKLRKEFAFKIFRFMRVFAIIVGVLLIINLGLPPLWRFSDKVLVTLMSGFFINVLGLILIILKFLFSEPRSSGK
jgi:hypothetical protein